MSEPPFGGSSSGRKSRSPRPVGETARRRVRRKELSEEEVKRMGEIQREVLRLCIALLDQPLQDNEYKNVIISGLAVLGIRADQGWLLT